MIKRYDKVIRLKDEINYQMKISDMDYKNLLTLNIQRVILFTRQTSQVLVDQSMKYSN
jgi:hypothetical protein